MNTAKSRKEKVFFASAYTWWSWLVNQEWFTQEPPDRTKVFPHGLQPNQHKTELWQYSSIAEYLSLAQNVLTSPDIFYSGVALSDNSCYFLFTFCKAPNSYPAGSIFLISTSRKNEKNPWNAAKQLTQGGNIGDGNWFTVTPICVLLCHSGPLNQSFWFKPYSFARISITHTKSRCKSLFQYVSF